MFVISTETFSILRTLDKETFIMFGCTHFGVSQVIYGALLRLL